MDVPCPGAGRDRLSSIGQRSGGFLQEERDLIIAVAGNFEHGRRVVVETHHAAGLAPVAQHNTMTVASVNMQVVNGAPVVEAVNHAPSPEVDNSLVDHTEYDDYIGL